MTAVHPAGLPRCRSVDSLSRSLDILPSSHATPTAAGAAGAPTAIAAAGEDIDDSSEAVRSRDDDSFLRSVARLSPRIDHHWATDPSPQTGTLQGWRSSRRPSSQLSGSTSNSANGALSPSSAERRNQLSSRSFDVLPQATTEFDGPASRPRSSTSVLGSMSLAQQIAAEDRRRKTEKELARLQITEEDTIQGPGGRRSQEDTPQGPGGQRSQEDTLQRPGRQRSQKSSRPDMDAHARKANVETKTEMSMPSDAARSEEVPLPSDAPPDTAPGSTAREVETSTDVSSDASQASTTQEVRSSDAPSGTSVVEAGGSLDAPSDISVASTAQGVEPSDAPSHSSPASIAQGVEPKVLLYESQKSLSAPDIRSFGPNKQSNGPEKHSRDEAHENLAAVPPPLVEKLEDDDTQYKDSMFSDLDQLIKALGSRKSPITLQPGPISMDRSRDSESAPALPPRPPRSNSHELSASHSVVRHPHRHHYPFTIPELPHDNQSKRPGQQPPVAELDGSPPGPFELSGEHRRAEAATQPIGQRERLDREAERRKSAFWKIQQEWDAQQKFDVPIYHHDSS
ncbi:MAG: hypothetical protein M1837_007008 [Sclerophora amabilis]|nr:MAG: hypothetical protein M1837_007008 [Sclerophora amabilis]